MEQRIGITVDVDPYRIVGDVAKLIQLFKFEIPIVYVVIRVFDLNICYL